MTHQNGKERGGSGACALVSVLTARRQPRRSAAFARNTLKLGAKPKDAKTQSTVPHSEIRSALRKIWMWRTTGKVRARARLSLGCYCCEACKRFVAKVEVDHLVPIGPTPGSRNATGDTTWDGFISRMFCADDGLQVICERCHQERTNAEIAGARDEAG